MKSEYQEYCEILDNMGLILNKNLIDKLKIKLGRIVAEIREEEKQEAMKVYNVSDLAIEIEKKLIEAKKASAKYKDYPELANLQIKVFYKWLLKKIYDK